jgi:hypothetical protein
MMALGGSIAVATLVGTFLGGLCAMHFGRRFSAPWTGFAFPGVVAMVLGSYAFRAMIGGLDMMAARSDGYWGIIGAALAALISACVLTISIAVGLLMAGAVWRQRKVYCTRRCFQVLCLFLGLELGLTRMTASERFIAISCHFRQLSARIRGGAHGTFATVCFR